MNIKFFIQIIFCFFVFVFMHIPVFAVDVNVSCASGGCSPDTVVGLFQGTIRWIPGRSIEKTIQVENATGMKQSVGLITKNIIVTGNVDSILTMNIRQQNGNFSIFSGSLETFFATPSFTLDTLDSAKIETYIFSLAMPSSAGNQYQSKSASFDMLVSLTEIQPVADNSKNGGNSSSNSNSLIASKTLGSSSIDSQVSGLSIGGQTGETLGEGIDVLGNLTLSAGNIIGSSRSSEILGFQLCFMCMVLPIPIIILFEIIFYNFGLLSEVKIIWRIIFGIVIYIFLYGIITMAYRL